MKTLSLYIDVDSPIHRIDPITKLWYVLFVIIVTTVLSNLRFSVFCLLISLSLLLCAGVFSRALSFFGFVTFVLITVVLIQGMFGVGNQTPAFKILGLTFYYEGLFTSVRIILRVYNIIAAFVILMLTSKPSELVEQLVDKGLSPRLGYVVLSVFQIIPQMMSGVYTIMDAQRSRGMETEGRLATRMRAFIPLLGPVVLNSLIGTKERAMALEIRAFGAKNPKSFLNECPVYPYARFMRIGMGLVALLAVVYETLRF